MYLYLAFFNKDTLLKGRFYLSGEYLEAVKLVFPNYQKLAGAEIKGCIGFLKGQANKESNSYSLKIKTIEGDTNYLSFQYEIDKELNISSDTIDKGLYLFAREANWINKVVRFYPTLIIVQKDDFDLIRKGNPNTRKISSYSAQIDQLKTQGDWIGICQIYEPLEKAQERADLWNNTNDLYNLAFACSKMGEPKNGLEKDRSHLANIKRYRELSISFFKRCFELEPRNYRYPSSIAYRYYQNVLELTKAKGRRDGKVIEEISEALFWFDKTLELNSKSIKDNYRKGKLILKRQIPNFLYSTREWTKEVFQEIEAMEQRAISSLEVAIQGYESLNSDIEKKWYFREYVKSLYCLGCYYIDKPKVIWNEYICTKLQKKAFINNMTREEMDYIVKARDHLEKAFQVETTQTLSPDLNPIQLSTEAKEWAVSPIDKLYRVGLVYLHMYFVKVSKNIDDETTKIYGHKAQGYFKVARAIGEEYRKLKIASRDIGYISEKLAWYYIFSGDYGQAIRLLERSQQSYIKNTHALALMLTNVQGNFQIAEAALMGAINDKYNKALDTSKALLAHLYKLRGQEDRYQEFVFNNKDKLKNSGRKLLALID